MLRTALFKLIGMQFACLIGLVGSVAFAQTASFTITEKAPGQERRVALVIGNGAYQHTSKLPNPPKDAVAIAGALSKLGFEVLRHSDLDQIGMTRAIRGFSDKLRGADVGLVFYAGHGIQVGGKNYLVPVDAKLAEERDLRFEAIDIELVLEQLQGGAKIGLVFLDACRDNPLSRTLSRSLGTRSGSVGAGLAPVQTGSGALIAYATQPGNVAEDGRSDNSPFTTALLRHMATPGIEARQMLTRVRADVRDLTNGRQIPWDHSSLEKDFYFGAPATPVVAAPSSPSTADPAAQSRSGAPALDREALFWQSIQPNPSAADFRAYLDSFPNGLYAPIARNRLAALEGARTPPGNSIDATPKPSTTTAALPSRTDVAPPAAPPGEDLRIETALGLTGQQRSTVQQALLALGYDPGGTDGAFGPRSRTAIKAWQKSVRIPETGYLTADQVTALMSAAKEPMAKLAQDQKNAQEAQSALAALGPRPPSSNSQGQPAVGLYPQQSRYSAGQVFRDCRECPEMVVIPAGSFTMGVPPGEEEREGVPSAFKQRSTPQQRISISSVFAVGKHSATVGEYRSFVQATGRGAGDGCTVVIGGKFEQKPDRDWRNPEFNQTDRHPVVCVSWEDAQAYVQWLNGKVNGGGYRLLSEAEWEYAARAETQTARYWGDAIGSGNTNCDGCGSKWDMKQTAPVGSFRPNAFGLDGMLGNANQFTMDCYNGSLSGYPSNGSARTSGDCARRTLRGGTWANDPWAVRASYRVGLLPGSRYSTSGFRVARTLSP